MNLKQTICTLTFITSVLSLLLPVVQAQSNSKGKTSRIVVGTLKSVDASGKKFDVLQNGEQLRQLHVNAKSVVQFVGLTPEGERKPRVGMEVKATCEKDDSIKSITFTPSVGEPEMLGEQRLKMTEQQLFNEVDKDSSNSISYVEFSRYIYHSPKHGPDSFRKVDKDSNGVLDVAEFAVALSKVSWWKLSRQSPDEWFLKADENKNGLLDMKEFASICSSGNHMENHFGRVDRDNSGSLTPRETTAYIRSVTHGKEKDRKKRK